VSCRCDAPRAPAGPPAIPAGLDTLARQPGTFADHRRALLSAASREHALGRWRARSSEEYGALLLELWAYVFDVVGFYDEVIAHEAYVGTARRAVSLRRLVGLLGYVPRPAVAASVALAGLADGPDAVLLPAGTGFRSGEPPQVFELDADTVAEPRWNRYPLAPVRPAALLEPATTTVLLRPRGVALAAGELALVAHPGGSRVVVVTALGERVEVDGATYPTATLDRDPDLPAGTALAGIEVLRSTKSFGLFKLPKLGTDPDALQLTTLTLEGLRRDLRVGDRVIVSKEADHRWFSLTSVTETQRTVVASLTSTIKDASNNVTGSVVSPAVTVPTTVIGLDASVNDRKPDATAADWVTGDAASLVVRAGLLTAAFVTLPLKRDLAPGDDLLVDGPVVPPPSGALPARFVLAPAEGEGAEVSGTLDPAERRLTPDTASALVEPLGGPVVAYGNVLAATRGETVQDELLGLGDETATHQRFTLKKSPLTYVPEAGTELGARSTLELRVGGRRWTEVPTLFGAGPEDEVFVTRPRDDGGTDVVFGGFGRGAPLPTGAAVTADYRFGAGAEVPPVRSITQVAKPVPGLAQVRNPVGAWGGADAEQPDELRRYAPRSALLLGRAVSLADMQAAAAGAPGVVAARADWRWSATRQRPVAHIAFIGPAAAVADVARTVSALCDPTTPVEAEVAVPEPHALALDLAVDPTLEPAAVAETVRVALAGGLLAPASLGVEGPLFRSVLFEAALDVAGVVAVQGVTVDGVPWNEVALVPADGQWLEIALTASGTVAA
jgi:predicted phage baseplate assembly protein